MTQPKENWEKELLDLCFEMRNRTYGSHYRILVKFIRTKISQALADQKKELAGLIKKECKEVSTEVIGRKAMLLDDILKIITNSK